MGLDELVSCALDVRLNQNAFVTFKVRWQIPRDVENRSQYSTNVDVGFYRVKVYNMRNNS